MTDIIVPRRGEKLLDENGEPTLRFIRWMEDLTGNSNLSGSELSAIQSFSTQAQWLQRQIDGLPQLTVDTTGFTIDTTIITTDKVIA